jgi:hypothetical protein
LDRPLLSLGVGEKYRYGVNAKNLAGQSVLLPSSLVFSSSDPSAVQIDSQGVITALNATPDPLSGARSSDLEYVASFTSLLQAVESTDLPTRLKKASSELGMLQRRDLGNLKSSCPSG